MAEDDETEHGEPQRYLAGVLAVVVGVALLLVLAVAWDADFAGMRAFQYTTPAAQAAQR